MSSEAPMFTYVPAPHERAYYGVLFQAADSERKGAIGGARAVEFFTRSKVPVPILKEIWKVSDQPGTNSLDPRKFAVAVRLIQLEQNGLKPTGPDLAVGVPPNLRPVFFEGIPIPGPPPQQQQQQPLPPQQHQRPPVSMAAGSVGGGASISGSVTGNGNYPHYQQQQLIVQDPYAMSPAEQSRYEQIFPEYCSKQDPYYVYGAEAVALFSKSGLEQAQLALIWSMVDTPTDNRLDKIEFAIAMHLIVCVSKKNLPVPPALPMSLVQLKAQPQTAAMSTNAAPIMNGSGNPASPPRIIQQQQPAVNNPPPPPIQAHMNIGGGPMAASGGGGVPWSTTSSAAPRDMQFQMAQGGGMPSPSMAAANPRDMQHQMAQGGGVSNFPSAAGNPRDMQFQMAQRGGMQSSPRATAAHASVVPPPLPISGVQGPPPLSQQGLGGVSISDAFEGLIGGGDTGSISSYRASTPVPAASSFQMAATASYNHSAYESIPPQDQSPPHVSTIYQPAPEAMRSAATSTQLASSYDMGEANEELEKLRGALQKLQAENISLKAKMGTMTDEEHDVQKELNATVAEVTKLATNLTNVRAQVLASKSRLLEASAELKATKERKGVIKDLIADATATKQAIDEAYESVEKANEAARAPPLLPVAASEEANLFEGWGDDEPAHTSLPADTGSHYSEAQNVDSKAKYSQPAPAHDEAPSYSFIQAEAPSVIGSVPAPTTNMYSGGGYTGGGHTRDASSGFGEVMGGGPVHQQQEFLSVNTSPGATKFNAVAHVPSMKEMEDLKSKYKEADDIARDAEASRRQIVAQLDELRRLADEAESKVRAATAVVVPKKKGLFRHGGAAQKRDEKEVQKLTMDAKDKKEAMLLVQAQVKDAEALAKATKLEAEKLNKEAESAQIMAAAAASLQDQPSPPATNGYQKGTAAPSYSFGHSTGPPSYGMSKPSMSQTPASNDDGGTYGRSPAGGFDSTVMGSGGNDIPTPSGFDDPYSNPFE